MNRIFLSLGSNTGDRESNINNAVTLLSERGTQQSRSSFTYETEPWGEKDQPYFYNKVIEAFTESDPFTLLKDIHEIENTLGRQRSTQRYGPRPIDIDILFYENKIITTIDLIIPHPLIHSRRFVMIPMADVEPDFRHPVLGRSIKELLKKCDDQGSVVRIL